MGEKRSAGPVGVFDSGVGGLSVVREIRRQLPEEDLIYFGDTARSPYGTKSADAVIRYSKQIADFLLSKHCKAIVIACNTATMFALKELGDTLPVPVAGTIAPGARAAVDATGNGKIGVIATKATVKSGIYKKSIQEIDKNLSVTEKECQDFVFLAENGHFSDETAYQTVSSVLSDFPLEEIDTLVLGCTHFPLLKETIRKVCPKNVVLVDPACYTAEALRQILSENELLLKDSSPERKQGSLQFYTTGDPDSFQKLCRAVLKEPVDEVFKVFPEE